MQRQGRYQDARQYKAMHCNQGWLSDPAASLTWHMMRGFGSLSSNAVLSNAMTDMLL
jgi:hypothetical protein